MKQLTTRQAKIIMMFYVCISKIMILPSLICARLDSDFYAIFISMFVIELLFILLILNINKRNPELSFKDYFEQKFGVFVTKMFYFIIGSIILFKTCMLFHETFMYFFESLYVDLKWRFVIFPSGIFAVYMSSRNLRNFGRTIEIFCYVVLGCILIAWFDGVPNVTFLNIIPKFDFASTDYFFPLVNSSIWFGDFLLLFFILGNIKVEKKISKEIIKGWVYGVVITLVTVVIFYGVFGITSSLRRMALIDLTQYAPKLSKTGNFIWLVNIIWPIILFYQLAIQTYFTTQAYSYCFNAKHNYRFMLSCIVVVATIVVLILFDLNITNLVNFIKGGFGAVVLFLQYILPFLMIIILILPFDVKERRKVYVK